MKRSRLSALVASAILIAGVAQAASPPATWDGLVQVKSKKFDLVYLQPGADFRGYTKVILEPVQVAFRKNWLRDYNRSASSLASRVSDSEVQEIVTDGAKAAGDIFSEAWTKGGYTIVQEPASDALTVTTGVVNISVTAPDQMTAGRSRTYAREAGYATFVVEVRDSQTNALMGRAIDQRTVGDDFVTWRNSTSNRVDFRREVQRWADLSVRGLNELKALSPIRQ